MSNLAENKDDSNFSDENKVMNIIDSDLKEGDMISDRYKIVYEIARTKLSAIYVADDTRLSRKVALKHIFRNNDPNNFKSLMHEAQLLSTMSHPNVLTVFDCSVDDKGAYVISEFLRGDTLEEYPTKNQLSIEQFVSFAEQMLLGLSEAHKQGIIHGDIKPNNVMILERRSDKKQLKLLDFGLSRIAYEGSENKVIQPMEGSAYFMSPEEFNGEAKSIASDLYSLGCVCYYAATGRYPFQGDNTMQIMAAHMQHKLHDPSIYRPDFPLHINEWIMWMINLKAENRPTDATNALNILLNCFQDYKHSEAKQNLLQEQAQELINQNISLEATAAHSHSAISAEDTASWVTLRNHALRSFSRLVEKQQAANFMVNILAKHNFAKNAVVPKELRRTIITDYFDLVPNRNKRNIMIQEIEPYL